MGLSRQEYWSGLSFPSARDLPSPGIKPSPPALQADSFLSEPSGKTPWDSCPLCCPGHSPRPAPQGHTPTMANRAHRWPLLSTSPAFLGTGTQPSSPPPLPDSLLPSWWAVGGNTPRREISLICSKIQTIKNFYSCFGNWSLKEGNMSTLRTEIYLGILHSS